MTWRVARSLDQLLEQLNALAPNRSRASDGSIGDTAHQSQGSDSDHNPWFVLSGQALVTARDFTHDPANGLDCNKLAAALIEAKDPRVKYLIWQGRLMDSRAVDGNGYRPWTWQPSSGHYQHLHLSVMANALADDPRPWSLPGLTSQEDDMPTADEVANAVINKLLTTEINRSHDGDEPPVSGKFQVAWLLAATDGHTGALKDLLRKLHTKVDAGFGMLSDDEANIIAAVRAQPTGGQVDVGALAAQLRGTLGDALADELAQRLGGGA